MFLVTFSSRSSAPTFSPRPQLKDKPGVAGKRAAFLGVFPFPPFPPWLAPSLPWAKREPAGWLRVAWSGEHFKASLGRRLEEVYRRLSRFPGFSLAPEAAGKGGSGWVL